MIPRLAARRAGRWFDERLRLSSVARHTIAKVFPDHWTFMMGEIALYSFLVLLLTGTYLTFFFEPSTSERLYDGVYAPLHGSDVSAAYASTMELSFDVRAGLLVRQTHHWAALVFIGAITVHLCRIFFTGAFRRPRELNWVVGLTMLLLGVLNGFAGYSLPDDLLSGTGLRIASAVLLSIPVAGPWLQFLAFGGEAPGVELEQRMYAVHILLVPGAIAALLVVHMAVLIRQKHTQFPGQGRRNSNVVGSRMWPTYAFRSLSLFCAVAAVVFGLGGLVQINPVWLWGPFSPAAVTSPAQPDWYVGWLDGGLRLFPPWEFRIAGYLVPSVFWPAVVLPGVLFGIMYLYPWLERAVTHDRGEHHVLQRPRDVPGRVAVGAYAIALFTFLLLAGANDLAARWLRIPLLTIIWFMRIATLVVPVVVAAVAFAVARSLRRSGAPTLAALPHDELLAEFEADLLGHPGGADGAGAHEGSEDGAGEEPEEAPAEEPQEPGAAPPDLPEHAPVEPGEAPGPHPRPQERQPARQSASQSMPAGRRQA